MANTLFLDCFSGCSGDMLVGMLLDLGYDPKKLQGHLNKLSIKGITFKTSKVKRHGLVGTLVTPIIKENQPHHRSYTTIKSIIELSSLHETIKKNAIACFKVLGQVEAKIHQTTLNKVHFHEVGALDTIFDIVSICSAFFDMSINHVLVSPINVGSGTIKCAHGDLPVPAPATAALLKGYPIFSKGPKTELTTPTAAAVIHFFAKPVEVMPEGVLSGIGYGAGTKEFDSSPNLLRGVLLDTVVPSTFLTDKIIMLKTNIDDQTPEIIAYIQDLLLKNKALDVSIVPIQMKKNRLGMQLEVICHWENVNSLSELILKETSAIGLRIEEIKRIILKRIIEKIAYKGMVIRVKYGYLGNRLIKAKPESADVQKAAQKLNKPLKEIVQDINRLSRKRLH